MKTTIIFLGVAALSFTNIIAANEMKEQTFDKQQVATTVFFENSLQENMLISSNEEKLKNNGGTVSDTTIFDPASVITTTNETKIEDIVTENKRIIEAEEVIYQPILLERTIEDSITENNQIIENNETNEVYPLDFEKINIENQIVKVSNNNSTITIDIKL